MISMKTQFKPLLALVTMTIVSMALTSCAPGEEEAVIIDETIKQQQLPVKFLPIQAVTISHLVVHAMALMAKVIQQRAFRD